MVSSMHICATSTNILSCSELGVDSGARDKVSAV